jgi:hypothetical protein
MAEEIASTPNSQRPPSARSGLYGRNDNGTSLQQPSGPWDMNEAINYIRIIRADAMAYGHQPALMELLRGTQVILRLIQVIERYFSF